jgi:cell division protein FtsW (lipid II flippase)
MKLADKIKDRKDREARKSKDRKEKKTAFYLGLLLTVWSTVFIGGSLFAAPDSVFPAGRTAAALTSVFLVCIGLMLMFMDKLSGWAGGILTSLLFSSIAAVLLILCFGPAESDGGIPFLPDSWNDMIARVLVGIFGFIAAGVALIAWYNLVYMIFKAFGKKKPEGA